MAPSGNQELTLAVLGCGTLGTAILSGVLSSLQEAKTSDSAASELDGIDSLPSKFIACIRSDTSLKRIKGALSDYVFDISYVQNNNIQVCKDADVIILGCKPYMVGDLLGQSGMKDALKNTLVISICAGVPVEQLTSSLYGKEHVKADGDCTFVRAMPNNAAKVGQSATVIAGAEIPIVTWIFSQVGEVAYLPESAMDVSTALCGSGPAFFALVLEAAIDGAVSMGMPRAEAMKLAAQSMKGCAMTVLNGEHPATLRDKTTTPGGCTMGGLAVLEEGAVRGTVGKAIREATVVASQLGAGIKNVNGQRR